MKILKIVLFLLFFLVASIFFVENSKTVSIYYFQEAPLDVPLYFVIICSLVLGALFGVMEGVLDKMRSARTIRLLKRELEAKERELTSLRNLPITESETKLPALSGDEAGNG